MQVKVTNTEIEGQHPLSFVTPVRLLKLRVLAAILLFFCTGSIFGLILIWSPRFYNKFLFEPCEEAVATHYIAEQTDGNQHSCARHMLQNHSYFIFRQRISLPRLLKYCYNSQAQEFQAMEFPCEGKIFSQAVSKKDEMSRSEKYTYFGHCKLEIPIEPPYVFFFNGLTGPFNILQYFSVAVWLAEGTILFPIILVCFTVAALSVNYGLYLRSRFLLQKLANIDQKVTIEENGTLREIHGNELVPGDILLLHENQQMNCDCAIIEGDVMVNEATLTGENIPIPKKAVADQSCIFSFEQMNQYCLFEGTKILRASAKCKAIVIRTGFQSLRGQYFRNVLYPAPPSKYFYIQAAKFIVELASIVVVVYLIMLRWNIPLGYTSKLLVLKFLDCLVWSVPPSLPIFFSICKTVALVSLGQKGVMGSNADKVENAGKIDTVCFDKTGTLTQLGLKALKHVSDPEQEQFTRYIMACCHHLVDIDGQLQGDPLEVEMFDYIKWEIKFGDSTFTVKNGNDSFEVLKIFEFSSARQMMSVVAKSAQGKHYLFSKGSTEMISHLAVKQNPQIVSEMQSYASKGFRVIGLGFKPLTDTEATYQREQLENSLNFVGLFILENPLKPDTADVITILKQANLDIKVISGDNPLTTTHCGKIANIVESDIEIQLLDIIDGEMTLNGKKSGLIDTMEQALAFEGNLAMTGKLLEHLAKCNEPKANITITNNSTNQIFSEDNQIDLDDPKVLDLFFKLIAKVRIFARQKPEQKKYIVSLLQQMGRQVMMVGDGANDCSAISQAQIGISFSESDASYTAPFASKSTSIRCVIIVLAQGKAAITTITEVFQYQLCVNIIKFIAACIMGIQAQNFADFQSIYIGYMSSLPFMLFLTFSQPCTELHPYIPLDNQFALPNQLSMFNMMLTSAIGMMINTIIIRKTTDHEAVPYGGTISAYTRSGLYNSVCFMACLFYYMSMGISMYISRPFKKQFAYNYILLLWTLACSIIAIVTIIFNNTAGWLDVININDALYQGYNWTVLSVLFITALIGGVNSYYIQKHYPSAVKLNFGNRIQ